MDAYAQANNASNLRRLREVAIANGKCQGCRKRDAKPGCVTCQVCLDRHRDRVVARVARGLCGCGRKPKRGILMCAVCAEGRSSRQRAARRISKRLRLCIRCSHAPACTRRAHCADCLDDQNVRARKHRARVGMHIDSKHCSICGGAGHTRQLHTRNGER